MYEMKRTKAVCDLYLSLGAPGFDLIVYKAGECVLRYMGGYENLEEKIPIKGDERYYVYSCSKPITCVAAMQLWEQGKFSMDDLLSKYLPEFTEMTVMDGDVIRKAENPIYIHQLFEMTAGFDYNVEDPWGVEAKAATGGVCPTREVMKYLAKTPLFFEPGTHWNYSLAHDVLAALVEVWSGMRFSEYVKKNIFDPLGMTNSTFAFPDEEKDTLASQYQMDGKTGAVRNFGKEVWRLKLGTEYESGGAGCVSTVEDYIKFLEALRVGDVILKKETIAMMATDRLPEHLREEYSRNESHGYGLGIRTPKEGSIFRDFGWGGAAGAYAIVDPEREITAYYGQHLLQPKNLEIANWLYAAIQVDLYDDEVFRAYLEEQKMTGNYNLTY